jgi:hypothetical protein
MTQEREPLWQAMRRAYTRVSGTLLDCDTGQERLPGADREEFAAMILAMRDYVAPDEGPLDPIWLGTCKEQNYGYNKRLRALLTAEAIRAERGE